MTATETQVDAETARYMNALVRDVVHGGGADWLPERVNQQVMDVLCSGVPGRAKLVALLDLLEVHVTPSMVAAWLRGRIGE